jgi:hypothetical protein
MYVGGLSLLYLIAHIYSLYLVWSDRPICPITSYVMYYKRNKVQRFSHLKLFIPSTEKLVQKES